MMRLPPSLRRLPAVLLIAAYLGLTGYYFGRHALGDRTGQPLAYFWTWDMFPNYPTESVRRIAVGRTEGGDHLRLFPNPRHRFRWGVRGDVTRIDIDRRRLFFRRAARAAARRRRRVGEDPVEHVYLIELYWPVRFNLPEDLAEGLLRECSFAGDVPGARSERRYWRIVEEFDLEGRRAGGTEGESP